MLCPVSRACTACSAAAAPTNTQAGGSQSEQLRIQLGRAIRQLKAHWKLGAVLVPLLQLPAAAPPGVEPGSAEEAPGGDSSSPSATAAEGGGGSAADAGGAEGGGAGGLAREQEQVQQQQAAVQLLVSAAEGFGLQECWQWKPLLDGKQVGGRGRGASCSRAVGGGCSTQGR